MAKEKKTNKNEQADNFENKRFEGSECEKKPNYRSFCEVLFLLLDEVKHYNLPKRYYQKVGLCFEMNSTHSATKIY